MRNAILLSAASLLLVISTATTEYRGIGENDVLTVDKRN